MFTHACQPDAYLTSCLSAFDTRHGIKKRRVSPLRSSDVFLLADNPVLCDPGLADLTVAFEVNHAKVYGVANNCPTTVAAPTEQTSPLPPLPPTLLLAAAAAASGGNVSFAATLE